MVWWGKFSSTMVSKNPGKSGKPLTFFAGKLAKYYKHF
jgi:hypothetical protein